MEELKAAARRDGITVPIFHNDKGRNLLLVGRSRARRSSTRPTPIRPASTATAPRSRASPTTASCATAPRSTRRARASATGRSSGPSSRAARSTPGAGPGYDRCRALTGPAFERMFYANNIENQFTAQNLYMTYGGTNWGWQADPNVVYTSYDYGAAFNEQRQLTEKVPVLKQLGYHGRHGDATCAKTDDLGEQPGSNPAIRVWAKAEPRHAARASTSSATPATARPPPTTRRRFTVDVPDGDATPAGRARQRPRLQDPPRRLRPRSASGSSTRRRRSTRTCRAASSGRRAAARPARREPARPCCATPSSRTCRVLAGDVTSPWDGARGDLRLDYIARRSGAGADQRRRAPPLDCCCSPTATRRRRSGGWTAPRGPLLVRGRRTWCARRAARSALARVDGRHRAHGPDRGLRPPRARRAVLERPARCTRRRTASGSLRGERCPGPRPVQLPALTAGGTRRRRPRRAPGFDDSGWTVADKTTTTTRRSPRRCRCSTPTTTASTTATSGTAATSRPPAPRPALALTAGTGRAGAWQVVGQRHAPRHGAHRHRERQPELERDVHAAAGPASRRAATTSSPCWCATWATTRTAAATTPQGAARSAVRRARRLRRAGRAGASRASAAARPGRPGARPAEQRRPVRRARRLVACPATPTRRWARVALPHRDRHAGRGVVPHRRPARPAARPGRARRPALHGRRGAPLPRADLRQRLERRPVHQRRRPAARVRAAAGHPAPPGLEHDRARGVVRRRDHRRARRSRASRRSATPRPACASATSSVRVRRFSRPRPPSGRRARAATRRARRPRF